MTPFRVDLSSKQTRPAKRGCGVDGLGGCGRARARGRSPDPRRSTSAAEELRPQVLAVHPRDVRERDELRADRLAFGFVRGVAEAFFVHALDQVDHASSALDAT